MVSQAVALAGRPVPVQFDRALAVEVHGRDVGVEGVEDRCQGLAAAQVLRRLGVPGVHVDDEAGVLGEQGHLALSVAPVGAVRVGVEQFPDGEPVGGLGSGDRWMDTHGDAS
jgi:hypothetical protein